MLKIKQKLVNDKYTVISHLYSSNVAELYIVEEEKSGRHCVAKVEKYATGKTFSRVFEEGRFLDKLQNKTLVPRIYAACNEPNDYPLVHLVIMERLGPSLE